MLQFHKGQRLIVLCDKKIRTEQQTFSRYTRQRQELIETIEQIKNEIITLEKIMTAQQLNNVALTKAEIYVQRRQQAMLLHQRQQLRFEHSMQLENLYDVENEIAQCQRQLAFLKRREIKFTQWTKSTKKEWLLQKEVINENEQQENIPWLI